MGASGIDVSKPLTARELRSISISEMKRFGTCRLQWYWASAPPRGLGLAPIWDEGPNLHFGRLVHEVLQKGYDTDRDFVGIYKTMVEEMRPKATGLFQGTSGKLDKLLIEGVGIMETYQEWSDQADKEIRFLATETRWENIEVPGTRGCGSAIIDAVVLRPDGVWLLDFKTTSFTNNAWTHQDLQATLYTYAGRKLIDPDIRGMIFRFILKKVPTKYSELLLKNGTVTKRQKLDGFTTYDEYYKALAVMTYREMYKGEPLTPEEALVGAREEKDDPTFKESFQNVRRIYYNELNSFNSTEGKQFIWDELQYRTKTQVDNYIKFYVAPRMNDILHPRWVGPTGLDSSFMGCRGCYFKTPCKLRMDGADYKTELAENFALSDHYKLESEDNGDGEGEDE